MIRLYVCVYIYKYTRTPGDPHHVSTTGFGYHLNIILLAIRRVLVTIIIRIIHVLVHASGIQRRSSDPHAADWLPLQQRVWRRPICTQYIARGTLQVGARNAWTDNTDVPVQRTAADTCPRLGSTIFDNAFLTHPTPARRRVRSTYRLCRLENRTTDDSSTPYIRSVSTREWRIFARTQWRGDNWLLRRAPRPPQSVGGFAVLSAA